MFDKTFMIILICF